MTKKAKILIPAIIVEDELIAKDILTTMINRYTPQVKILGYAEGIGEAKDLIEAFNPQIVFLDIQLSDGDAFDLLQELGGKIRHIIFVTAYDQFALKAIKFHAFDYLLKPIDYLELIETIQKLELKLESNIDDVSLMNYLRSVEDDRIENVKIAIPNKDQKVFIKLSSIIHLQADRGYTWIYLKEGGKIFSSKNLGEYEKILPNFEDGNSFSFLRVHHGHLVNSMFIKSYEPKTALLILDNDNEVSVSQRRKSMFKKILPMITFGV